MSPSGKKTVLVAGATGQQGGAVARLLLEKGHQVKALTRNPESPAAKEIQGLGAHLTKGGFDDEAALKGAVEGADAVFAMGTPYEGGADTETRQSLALLEAAQAGGVGHIVYTSVASADTNTGIPHFESKYAAEKKLATLDVPYTILGPVWFMENIVSPWFLPQLKEGKVAIALPPSCKLQQVAVRNIGTVAAQVLDAPEGHLGKRYELAGDEITGVEMTEIISRVIGKKLEYFQVPIEMVRQSSEDWAKMFEWFEKVGYSADIDGLKSEFPGAGWLTFEEWAKEQDWSVLDG